MGEEEGLLWISHLSFKGWRRAGRLWSLSLTASRGFSPPSSSRGEFWHSQKMGAFRTGLISAQMNFLHWLIFSLIEGILISVPFAFFFFFSFFLKLLIFPLHVALPAVVASKRTCETQNIFLFCMQSLPST